ncbi:hypothetical protein ACFZDJ_11960 [Streptomyces sp. NPDC007896]|uniref:hypothetical protein n=1 Tax=unclassified Streptomyces TaxID=2593676 RepID=UPI0036E98167
MAAGGLLTSQCRRAAARVRPGEDIFDVPDHADGSWQRTSPVDLQSGPIDAVAVAVTHERLSEQCDVTLYRAVSHSGLPTARSTSMH